MHMWAAGIITGVVLVGFIGSVTQVELPSFSYNWIPDDWETLLVGLVALFHYQAYRKEIAAKAERTALGATGRLTNDLSDLSTYASNAMAFAKKLHKYLLLENRVRELEGGHRAFEGGLEQWNEELHEARNAVEEKKEELLKDKIPRLEQGSIDRIADAGIHLGSERVIDLLKAYQVQYARLSTYIERIKEPETGNTTHIVTTLNGVDGMKDAARVYVLAEKLFSEARRGWKFYNDDVSDEEIEICLLTRIGWEKPHKDIDR